MYITQLYAGHWYICELTSWRYSKAYNRALYLHPACHTCYDTRQDAEAALAAAKVETGAL